MTRLSRWRRSVAAAVTTSIIAALLVGSAASASWADDALETEQSAAAVDAPAAEPQRAEPEPAVVPAAVADPVVDPEPAAEPVAQEPVAQPDTHAPMAGTGDPQEPKPDVTVTVPDNGRFAWNNEVTAVSIRATSRIGDIQSVTWSTTGAQTGGATVAGGFTTVEINTEGTTVITVTATDSDGNGSDPVTRTVKLDLTDPTSVILSPTTRVLRVGEKFEPQLDCADALAGVEQCYLRIGNNTFDSGYPGSMARVGDFPVYASAIDNAGNFVEVPAGIMRVADEESNAPVISVDAPALPATGWYADRFTVRFDANDGVGSGVEYVEYRSQNGSGAWSSWTRVPGDWAAVLVSRDGTNRYEARAADRFGNVSATTAAAFALDDTNPGIAIDSPADAVEVALDDELRLEFSCADTGSGLADCTGTVPSGGVLDTSEPGTFEFRVTAIDVAGNIAETVRGYTVTAPDVTAPVVTVAAPVVPDSGWYTEEPTITLSADDPSGVSELIWDVVNPFGGSSSGSTSSGTAQFDDFMDGLTSIRYRAVDTAGNEGEQQTLLVRLDRNVPWVVVTGPQTHPALVAADQEFEQGDEVALTFRCGDDASGLQSCVSSSGATLPTGTLGTQTVTITATDRAGLVSVEQVAYTVVAATTEPQPQVGGDSSDPQGAANGVAALAYTGTNPFLSLLIAVALVLIGGIVAGSVLVVRRGR